MRILHFCMQASFAENYSYQDNLLTEYQHKHGHGVRIVTTTKTRGENGKYVYSEPCKKMLNNGVELIRVTVNSKLRNAFGVYSGMLQQLKEYQPDLIFIHGLCSCIPKDAVKYKKKYNPRVHIVADNHQDAWTTSINGLYSTISFRMFRIGWRKWISSFDKVYGTTSWRVRFAREYYGIPENKLDVLIMGIDSDRLPDDRDHVRNTYRSSIKENIW